MPLTAHRESDSKYQRNDMYDLRSYIKRISYIVLEQAQENLNFSTVYRLSISASFCNVIIVDNSGVQEVLMTSRILQFMGKLKITLPIISKMNSASNILAIHSFSYLE